MKLLDLQTQTELEAVILEVLDEDFRKIRKSKQFLFDRAEEKGNQVFKIVKAAEEPEQEILGLLSITNIPEEFRIQVNLVEISEANKGKKKKIDRIAGCLLAFAVQVAFEKGYSGFTSLIPKTELISLYVEKYGFSQYGRQLAIEGKAAIALIQKYL
jgi:hypothetical protein